MYDILDFSWLVRFHSLIIKLPNNADVPMFCDMVQSVGKYRLNQNQVWWLALMWKLLEHRDLTIRLVQQPHERKIQGKGQIRHPPFNRNDVLFSLSPGPGQQTDILFRKCAFPASFSCPLFFFELIMPIIQCPLGFVCSIYETYIEF